MFDFQEYVRNAMLARRNEELKSSPQITLGELIAMLEAVKNKNLTVTFDVPFHPGEIDSWRGSYDELAIRYLNHGNPPTVRKLLDDLVFANGCTFTGYKGGDYVMGKRTPIWVANYGESGGPRNDNSTAITGVSVTDTHVEIETAELEY